MRTSQRHHLKENELAMALGQARDFTLRHQRTVKLVVSTLTIVVIAAMAFIAWRSNVESKARAGLAQGMVIMEARVAAPTPGTTPNAPPTQQPGTYPTEKAKLEAALPKFTATADEYPGTQAGKTARFNAGATLVALGRFDEAAKQYDQIAGEKGLLGQSAKLGKAEAQFRAGQYDASIATFKELSERTDTNLPKEAILLQLARVYKQAGKTEDAKKTLTQIVEQHADSPFAAEARTELDRLKG